MGRAMVGAVKQMQLNLGAYKKLRTQIFLSGVTRHETHKFFLKTVNDFQLKIILYIDL